MLLAFSLIQELCNFVLFVDYKRYNMAESLNRGNAGGPCIKKVDWQDKNECVTAAFHRPKMSCVSQICERPAREGRGREGEGERGEML